MISWVFNSRKQQYTFTGKFLVLPKFELRPKFSWFYDNLWFCFGSSKTLRKTV